MQEGGRVYFNVLDDFVFLGVLWFAALFYGIMTSDGGKRKGLF